MKNKKEPDEPTPFSQRTDDDIRHLARELHEKLWAVEIPDDAKVTRRDDADEIAEVEAIICLGLYD